jgi:hypothetical protein
MSGIQRVAKSVKLLAHALFWVCAIAVIVAIISAARGGTLPRAFGPSMWVVEGYMVVGALLLAGIFRHVAGLAALYEAGRLFTEENVRHMRWIGWLAVATTVTPRLDVTGPAPGIGLAFSPSVLVLGLVFVFMSWVVDEARKLEDESKLVI